MRQSLNVYIHAASMGDHWREIVAELVGMIDGSGLYDAAASLKCIVVGGGSTRYLSSRGLPKWDTIEYGGWLDEYEYPTLRMLWEDAQKSHEGNCLYLHTKGASSTSENNVGAYSGKRFRDRWRKIMAYYLVTQWRQRIEELESADTVGCFQVGPPFHFYAGNFWWATAEHVKRLPEPNPREYGEPGGEHPRLWAELWLHSIPFKSHCCYHQHLADMNHEYVTGEYRA